MLLKLPHDLYEVIKQKKGDMSHQTFIISILKQQLLTTTHGENNGKESKETESIS